jgi:hypothetical protein
VEDVGAPVAGVVAFGPHRFARLLVTSRREQPGERDFFASAPYHVGGLFGNALFYDAHVVVVDLPGRRFGVAAARRGPASARRGLTGR